MARQDLDLGEACGVGRRLRLVVRVAVSLPNREDRQGQARQGEGDAEGERPRSQPEGRRHVSGDEGGPAEGEVPSGLVQTHGQSTPPRTGQVDLHDHRRGPGETLAHAKQDVGEEDPVPGARPHEEERNGQGDQPPRHQNWLASHVVGQTSGEIVRECLGDTEGDDE